MKHKVTREQFLEIEQELENIDSMFDDSAPISIHSRLYLALERAGVTVFSREQALRDAQDIVSHGWGR